MNRRHAKEFLPIIKAYAEGREIQYKLMHESEDKWEDIEAPIWSPNCQYRIKPEPVEKWLIIGKDEFVAGICGSLKAAQIELDYLDQVERSAPHRIAHVREVEE